MLPKGNMLHYYDDDDDKQSIVPKHKKYEYRNSTCYNSYGQS